MYRRTIHQRRGLFTAAYPLLVGLLISLASCGGSEATPTASPLPTATASPVPPTPTSVASPAATPTRPSGPEQVTSLSASKDNTLYESGDGSLSNGGGAHFFAGATGGFSIRRGLIAFDIASAIPAGATIGSATLKLEVSKTASTRDTHDVFLHRVLADWGEGTVIATGGGGGEGGGGLAAQGDVTWLHRFHDTDSWDTPGGDFAAEASGATPLSLTGSYTWESTARLVNDVQSWLDDPSTNFGWIIMGGEDSSRTSKRFDSREHEEEANRPVLTVTFVAP